jgi:glutathione S-transferase
MITLFQFPRYWGLPNISPFCLKLETYLRLTQQPYEVVSTRKMSRAPHGKLPFIKDGEKTLADTSLIIEYLKKTYGDPLDADLTPLQKAQGLAIQRMVEEHLYWVITYSRWLDPRSTQTMKDTIFAQVPRFIKPFILKQIRKQLGKQLYQHGIGRHTPEEMYAFGVSDLEALVELLMGQSFLFGDKPTSFDVCVFAFVANILFTPINSPLKACVTRHPELAAFCERMQKLAYPMSDAEEKDFYYQGA